MVIKSVPVEPPTNLVCLPYLTPNRNHQIIKSLIAEFQIKADFIDKVSSYSP